MGTQSTLLLPLALIVIGTGWLLGTLGVVPNINWVWTLSLAAAGLFVFATSGLDKFSVVLGPMFVAASLLSVLRQTGRLSIDTEVPILVILAGVLLLVSRSPKIPIPKWVEEAKRVEK
jgi:hypothetical protein